MSCSSGQSPAAFPGLHAQKLRRRAVGLTTSYPIRHGVRTGCR